MQYWYLSETSAITRTLSLNLLCPWITPLHCYTIHFRLSGSLLLGLKSFFEPEGEPLLRFINEALTSEALL